MTDKNDDFSPAQIAKLAQIEDALRSHMDDLLARTNLLDFLLQQAYANTFESNAQGFARFMDGTMERIKNAPSKTAPMSDEHAQEAQVRLLVHAARFRDRVLERLARP